MYHECDISLCSDRPPQEKACDKQYSWIVVHVLIHTTILLYARLGTELLITALDCCSDTLYPTPAELWLGLPRLTDGRLLAAISRYVFLTFFSRALHKSGGPQNITGWVEAGQFFRNITGGLGSGGAGGFRNITGRLRSDHVNHMI